jgi:copper chaperone NosL
VVRPGDFTVILVADYSPPGKMLQAEQTVFLQDDHISSPMGAHLAAFPTKETARKYQASAHGRIIDWNDLLMLEQ